ncbi:MAG: hypothetical protein GXY44_02520 [Phycisphaerales bacterium]|nr:hypothetical protein [Phycisphaerales bacterium]
MERLALLFPALITVSTLSAIVSFFFLQSRAQGPARLMIIAGGLFLAFPSLYMIGVGKDEDAMVWGVIAAGAANIGTILLSIGVLLFAISLPSKRLCMKAEDKRTLSDKIIQEMSDIK